MNLCSTPDCQNYVEGRTNFCASCNSQKRKSERLSLKPQKERKGIKKVSDKQKDRNKLYSEQRKEYLKRHPHCQLRFFKVCTSIATTIHHIAKRGINTNDVSTFRSACFDCHDYLETVMTAKERRALGLLITKPTETI